MQDQRVAVGIGEERHVADAGVALADELDALRLELGARGGHVATRSAIPWLAPLENSTP